jgi:integrase/recombinase XerD
MSTHFFDRSPNKRLSYRAAFHSFQEQHNTHSETYFKHTFYGLRALFKVENISADHIKLPKIKLANKLPVVLSKPEIKRLLLAPNLHKHRILIGLLYVCGLRCFEARNVRLSDSDFERAALHVRQGKRNATRGAKDRYVPLSQHLIRGLKKISKPKNLNNGSLMDKYKSGKAVTSMGDIPNGKY